MQVPSKVGWMPVESVCFECREPIIRDVPSRRYCIPCAEARKKRFGAERSARLYPKIKKQRDESKNAWYRKNRDKVLARQKRYNDEHRDEIRMKQKLWYIRKVKEMNER